MKFITAQNSNNESVKIYISEASDSLTPNGVIHIYHGLAEYFGRYEHSKLPDDLKDKYHSIDGKKGTAIIVNTADILHRAGDPVENKSRLTFFILLNSEKGWGDNNNFLLMPKV